MAIVRPFKGLRPKADRAKEVASPPYDVLSTQEAKEMAMNNPNSFLRVNKAELEFDQGSDPYSEKVYQRGKDNLMRLWNEGIMVRDSKPSFYLYRLTMNGRSQTGLVALTSVDEYDKGIIKKHEHTRPQKVSDRANHITFLGAQVGPVFSTFKYSEAVGEVFGRVTSKPPTTDFVADDGVRHELWVVDDDPTVQAIVDAFGALKELYIADGHHRSAAAAEVCHRFREKNPGYSGDEIVNFFLNVLFPDRELHILPYNRVVKDMNGLDLPSLLEQTSARFAVEPHDGEVNPNEPHQFGLYADGRWQVLTAKPGSFDASSPTQSIDAAILQRNLIDPILGIDNPKTDDRIDFVGGIRGTRELVKLVDSGVYKIAFSLYPTSIQQLIDVADAGEVMPPKSTWFEPKLRSGMVVNLLTE